MFWNKRKNMISDQLKLMYIIIIQTDTYCGRIVILGVPIFVDVVFNNNNKKNTKYNTQQNAKCPYYYFVPSMKPRIKAPTKKRNFLQTTNENTFILYPENSLNEVLLMLLMKI